MQKLSEFRPTVFDKAGLGSKGREDWLVLPCLIVRDSDPLEISNFEAAQKILGEHEVEYDILRYNHWGPGWFELIVIPPEPRYVRVAEEIASKLEEYPVLDEDDYYEREYESVTDNFERWQLDELLDHIHSVLDEEQALKLGECDLFELAQSASNGYAYSGPSVYLDIDYSQLDEQRLLEFLQEQTNGEAS